MDLAEKQEIPQTYKDWFAADLRHTNVWRKEAKLDFGYRDGAQWTDEEKRTLEDRNQPPTCFNLILPIVDAVSGQEISNRKEVRYIPRKMGPALPEELLTEAGRWFRDKADADDNDSEAFRDTITGGMGWTETRLDYEDNPDGDLKDDRIDPFEMVWDCNAKKRNLLDARRVWHVKQMPIAEARALAPGFGDEELHASWAADAVWDDDDPHDATKVRNRSVANSDASGADLDEVVIVHCQWIELETRWRVPIPGAGLKDFAADEYKAFKAQYAEKINGGKEPKDEEIGAVRQRKKVRYRALLGNIVLKVTPTACPTHFNFQCITGKRDQIKNQWFGMVRVMRDPQSWSNKFFSQILHIINSNAKGGIMAERGQAFDNDADAEESWARADRITWMKAGALSGQNAKFAEKPQTQFPQGLQVLMEYAADGVRRVGGVSLELLGQVEGNQPGVLEYQRKQAGLTILSPLFDNLKSYRREQGEIILYYIQNDLSDGRLIKVIGKDNAQYVPLVKNETLEYDLIVDDMPTSPNQKEMSWQIITSILPVIKDMLSPETMLMFLESSPLPATTLDKMKAKAQEQQQAPMAQLQQQVAAIQAQLEQAKVAQTQADAELKRAQAVQALSGAPDPQAEYELKQLETTGHIQVKQAEVQGNLQIAQQKAQGDIAVAQAKASADMQVQQQKHAGDMQMAQQRHAVDLQTAQQDAALKQQTAAQDAAIKERAASSQIAIGEKTADAKIAVADKTAKAAAKRKPTK